MNTNTARRVARIALGVAVATVGLSGAGCEDSSAPPPAPAGGGSAGTVDTSSSGGKNSALSHMSDQPTSTLGRSAQSGKNAARQLDQSQARELGMARELTGEAAETEVAGLIFSAPTEWTKVAPTATRAAEFKAGDDGDASIVFFFFPGGQGGNVTQNLDRWKRMVVDQSGQPVEQDVTRRTVNGMATTFAAADGTYLDGMPGQTPTQRKDYSFRGAIIEGPQGSVFVRMTGPKTTVQTVEPAWRQMIEGARKK